MPDPRSSEQPSSAQLLCSIKDWQEGKHRRECTWTASPGVHGYAVTNVYLRGERQRWRNERVKKKRTWSHCCCQKRSAHRLDSKNTFHLLHFFWEIMKQIRLKITQILTKLLIHPSWVVTRGQQRERSLSSASQPQTSVGSRVSF